MYTLSILENMNTANVTGNDFVGGLIGATVVLLSFDVFRVFDRLPNVGLTHLFDQVGFSVLAYLLFAPVCTLLAIIGDLAASWLNRWHISKPLQYVGTRTLDVYLLHYFCYVSPLSSEVRASHL